MTVSTCPIDSGDPDFEPGPGGSTDHLSDTGGNG